MSKPLEKDDVLQIRISKDDKAAIKQAAAVAGLTVTELIIGVLAGERIGDVVFGKK